MLNAHTSDQYIFSEWHKVGMTVLMLNLVKVLITRCSIVLPSLVCWWINSARTLIGIWTFSNGFPHGNLIWKWLLCWDLSFPVSGDVSWRPIKPKEHLTFTSVPWKENEKRNLFRWVKSSLKIMNTVHEFIQKHLQVNVEKVRLKEWKPLRLNLS